MEEGVIVVDTTGRRKPPEHLLAELYDFKAMVFLCYHENFHRTKFVEWWAKGGDENNAYANWLQDQNLPPDLRQDRDGDKIPNNIEIELDLDPRKNLTNNNNFLTDDFEWLAYYNHKRWIDDINSDQKYILNDWAYPGNQTK
jgi:hypothetical protein